MRILSYPEDNAEIPAEITKVLKSKGSDAYRIKELTQVVGYLTEWIADIDRKLKKKDFN